MRVAPHRRRPNDADPVDNGGRSLRDTLFDQEGQLVDKNQLRAGGLMFPSMYLLAGHSLVSSILSLCSVIFVHQADQNVQRGTSRRRNNSYRCGKAESE
jgi:hypothetical protein